jgi:glycosyltransferase
METLEDCIMSVSNQTYKDIEYIIVDGGSTDGTIDIIKKYENKISRWISEPDSGIYDALNKGLKLATGDVIGFLHADDQYASDRVLERIAENITKHNVDSCYGDLEYVHRYNSEKVVRFWKSAPYKDNLMTSGWMPPHPTFFAKKEIYDKFGYFDTNFKIAADYELMLRFIEKNSITTHYIPEVFVKMRTGGMSNRSLGNLIRKSAEDYRAIKMHNIGGIGTLIRKNFSKVPQFLRVK